jgi:hypothetical protein
VHWTVKVDDDKRLYVWKDGTAVDSAILDWTGNHVVVECSKHSFKDLFRLPSKELRECALDSTSAFHDKEEIGPRMLARIANSGPFLAFPRRCAGKLSIALPQSPQTATSLAFHLSSRPASSELQFPSPPTTARA